MSNQYGPRIVTDGLVFCLDARNNKGYSGSGTTILDLSGNNSNINMVNGTTILNGNMVFDGINDYVTTTAGQSYYQYTTNLTACSWFKRNGNIAGGAGGGQSTADIDSWASGNVWLFHGNNSPNNSISFFVNAGSYFRGRDSGFLNDNTWYFICGTASSSAVKIFVNGIQIGSSTAGINSGTIVNNSNSVIQYGKDPRFASSRFFNGSIGPCYVYNRELSLNEILQNYNATKSRFNL